MTGLLFAVGLSACSFTPRSSAFIPAESPIVAGHLTGGGVGPAVVQPSDDPEAAALLPEPDLTVRPEVERQVADLRRCRRFIEQAVLRREEYLPLIQEIFAEEAVPLDLVNVALIESGFNPHARSYAGAVGMWQFMRSTGRNYGLQITRKVDERKNVALSTRAAARHLRDLFEIYGDWYLALGAYNAGVGGINRAIKRAGSEDFWTVAKKGRLKRQTIDYVPRFIAATLIVNDLAGHGFEALAQNIESMRLAKNGTVPGSEIDRASYRPR